MPLVTRFRGLVKAVIVWRARDVTDEVAVRSAVVLAPHPDDETLGCGGVILRKRAAGTPVTVVVVTDGRHSHRTAAITPDMLAARRHEELREAAVRLQLAPDSVRWIDIEDGTVASNEDRLVSIVEELLAELKPDELYVTSADEPHPDHAAVGRAGRRAARSLPGVTVLEYPVWLWESWPLRPGNRIGSLLEAAGRILGRHAVAVQTESFLAAKLLALDAHQTQVARPAGILASEEWAVLPDQVMKAAGEGVEIFFPSDTAP